MKKLPFFLLILLLVTISHVHSQKTPMLMRFVLQWPPTFCIQLKSAEEPGRCNEPIPQRKFTLHGLWPADEKGYVITCPPPKKEPNWKDLFQPIETKLVTFWSQLREGPDKWALWKHEWRTHGVCAGTTSTAEVYFNTAIKINNLIKSDNLFNYLKTNGIIACDSLAFAQKDIVQAIQKVFVPSALDFYLTCVPISLQNNTHVYLSEVTLCTDKEGTKFISCPRQAAPQTSCSADKLIMLPHPEAQPPAPPPPRRFQEETDGIYSTAEINVW